MLTASWQIKVVSDRRIAKTQRLTEIGLDARAAKRRAVRSFFVQPQHVRDFLQWSGTIFMKMCCGKLGWFALLCVLALAGSAPAQDLIGVLPEVLQPEVAEKLKLSEEQRAQFSALLKRRESEMVGLAQQLREVP